MPAIAPMCTPSAEVPPWVSSRSLRKASVNRRHDASRSERGETQAQEAREHEAQEAAQAASAAATATAVASEEEPESEPSLEAADADPTEEVSADEDPLSGSE